MRPTLLDRFLPLLVGCIFLAAPWLAKADAFDPRLGSPFEKRDRPVLGSDEAPIVVIEFGSYKCPHCEAFHQEVFPQLKEQFISSGKVQWFMVPTSDDSADQSSRIFAIGRCIHRQGKFWDTLDFLMKVGHRPSTFLDGLIAKNATINAEDLGFCLQDREIRRVVDKDFDEYHLLKVTGTPTYIIRKLKSDGSRTETTVKGYHPAEYFQRIFDELAKSP